MLASEISMPFRSMSFYVRAVHRHFCYLTQPRFKLLTTLRGYRKSRALYGHSFIRDIKLMMSQEYHHAIDAPFLNSYYIPSAYSTIVSKQLIKRYVLDGSGIQLEIYRCLANESSFRYPAPKPCLDVLKRYNLKVDYNACEILWTLRLVRSFLGQTAGSIRQVAKHLYTASVSVDEELPDIVLADQRVMKSNIRSESNELRDIIKWIQESRPNLRFSKVPFVACAGTALIDTHIYSLRFSTYSSILSLWLCRSSCRLLCDYLRVFVGIIVQLIISGRGRLSALLVEESLISCALRRIPTLENVEIIFSDNWYYRPIWSYIAEQRGAKISFYFYSINNEGFFADGNRRGGDFDSYDLSWPVIYCWNKEHLTFLSGLNKTIPTFKIGTFILSDGGAACPTDIVPARSVAVFDIQPRNQKLRYSYGIPNTYINPEICVRFLRDIHELCCRYNVLMLHKQKRVIPFHVYDKRYLRFCDELQSSLFYRSIDSRTSPKKLFSMGIKSITFPFSSVPHLIGEATQESSSHIYYDTTSLFKNKNPPSYGATIVHGYDELVIWFEDQFGRGSVH